MNKKNNFKRIIFIISIIIVESIIFKLLSNVDYKSICEWIIIGINIIPVSFSLLKNKNEENFKINSIILFSFVVRNIVLFLDIYGYTRGFTGSDTEAFYKGAIGITNYSHNYAKLLRVFVLFVGTSRTALQYINVVISLFSMIIMKKILLYVSNNNYKKILWYQIIFSLAPANILLSCALLREAIMIFLNILSIYYFIKWYKNGKVRYFVLSCIYIFLSSWLHSGMLLAIVGYVFAFILYSQKTKKIAIKKNTIFSLILVSALLIGLFATFGDSVTRYFNKIDKLEDVTVKKSFGNTDYLSFISNVKSVPIIILCTPLKIIYFYFSPMPWNCYSLSVLLVFVFSSTIYMFLYYNILRNKALDKNLKIILIIVLVALSIAYAWGTGNAGTAMRHREKILPILIILYCISSETKKKRKNKNENIV